MNATSRPRISPPFAPSTVSLALYADPGPPRVMLDQVFAQAQAAEQAGVDGVTISEHHAGFVPYVPNPVQVAGWVLDRTDQLWVGPCPLLLPLRPTALVVEELCWLSSLHPGRLGVGVAPGYAAGDFEVVGLHPGDRADRFSEQLPVLAKALRGDVEGPLQQDPAVSATTTAPVPLVVAAGSKTAARRAAHAGAGILTDSMGTLERVLGVFRAYEEAGGTGPRMLNRRVWIGEPPHELVEQQQARYRSAAGGDAWMAGSAMHQLAGEPAAIGQMLADLLSETGADHLGLKVHIEGIGQPMLMEQIEGLSEVLTSMHRGLSPGKLR